LHSIRNFFCNEEIRLSKIQKNFEIKFFKNDKMFLEKLIEEYLK